jgi:K(+)-stimulated pyrophosphate-energized sodium pump
MSVAGWVWFFTAISAGSIWLTRVGFARGHERLWARVRSLASRAVGASLAVGSLLAATVGTALAQTTPEAGGGEANLRLPDLSQVSFLGIDGHRLLMVGILFCIFGLIFGLTIFVRLRNLPVHRSMLEISELIYETCKTYLVTQGKFLLLLEAFITVIIVLYFGVLLHYEAIRVGVIFLFSILGIAGSFGVAWFGIRAPPLPGFAASRIRSTKFRSTPA